MALINLLQQGCYICTLAALVAHLKSNSFYSFIPFGLFVITPSIIQLANYKNVHFYYVSNLLTRPFFLSTETTKRYGNPPLSSGAGISPARCIISFHFHSELISVQPSSSSQVVRTGPSPSTLNFRFMPV